MPEKAERSGTTRSTGETKLPSHLSKRASSRSQMRLRTAFRTRSPNKDLVECWWHHPRSTTLGPCRWSALYQCSDKGTRLLVTTTAATSPWRSVVYLGLTSLTRTFVRYQGAAEPLGALAGQHFVHVEFHDSVCCCAMVLSTLSPLLSAPLSAFFFFSSYAHLSFISDVFCTTIVALLSPVFALFDGLSSFTILSPGMHCIKSKLRLTTFSTPPGLAMS